MSGRAATEARKLHLWVNAMVCWSKKAEAFSGITNASVMLAWGIMCAGLLCTIEAFGPPATLKWKFKTGGVVKSSPTIDHVSPIRHTFPVA